MNEHNREGDTIPSRVARIKWIAEQMAGTEDPEAILGMCGTLQDENDALAEMTMAAIDKRDIAAAREYQKETGDGPVPAADRLDDIFTEEENFIPTEQPPKHYKKSFDDEGRTTIRFEDEDDDGPVKMPF